MQLIKFNVILLIIVLLFRVPMRTHCFTVSDAWMEELQAKDHGATGQSIQHQCGASQMSHQCSS